MNNILHARNYGIVPPAISVTTPQGSYSVIVQPGLLNNLAGHLAELAQHDKIVVVTNSTVARLYTNRFAPGCQCEWVVVEDGECYKTFVSLHHIYEQFLQLGLDRYGVVVALGGGVVGDLAGFAAATYMRGVKLIQVPTTLLAMVDSSIGGKVAVDIPSGKNLVGAFHQPQLVAIDPEVLDTLPLTEWRCGMAEVIKHGLLADPQLLELCCRPVIEGHSRSELLYRAIQVKVAIVSADPFEQGIRQHLNLGHTFAHAAELVSGYRLTHGNAVAVGLLAAARLSRLIGLCPDSLPGRVAQILGDIGLPLHWHGLDPEQLYKAMTADKKRRQGQGRFILLADIAKPVIRTGLPRKSIMEVLRQIALEMTTSYSTSSVIGQ